MKTSLLLLQKWKNFLTVLFIIVFAVISKRGVAQSQTFTSPGIFTFTVPAGVTQVTAEAWGGGGAGGGASSIPSAGGGGAGGSYARKKITVTPGANVTVTVGNSGLESWFGSNSTVFAQGGSNGGVGTNGAGGIGSASLSIGDFVFAGGSGSNGNSSGPADIRTSRCRCSPARRM